MKKFLCFCAFALLMATATFAAPTYTEVGQECAQASFVQSDAQQMTVDFVFIHADDVVYTIATTAETEYAHYLASPAEVRTQVFDFTTPVFRLCNRKANAFKSNLYTGWRGLNSNPPSQYDRA